MKAVVEVEDKLEDQNQELRSELEEVIILIKMRQETQMRKCIQVEWLWWSLID